MLTTAIVAGLAVAIWGVIKFQSTSELKRAKDSSGFAAAALAGTKASDFDPSK
jgi:hypothetical protein